MEGERQALVARTDAERLQACQRIYDRELDRMEQAENALEQWTYRHQNHSDSDPAFLQLEQRVNDAARRIQIANQALQDARRASEAWIDTGTAYLLLYIYL